ncbi:MAG: RDD family protein [Betaproteobacteria bacterium]|nr:MAG: RDD family protein [Betaproteobacteria bacterium]
MNRLTQPELAGIWRRLASLAYEAVLLFAIVFVAAYLFVALAGRTPQGMLRWIFYLYLLCVAGAYFVFCWVRSGQTLAQKAWGLKVTAIDGSLLQWRRAALRYMMAVVSIGSGIGLLWAFLDPQRQFLHDRLAGSRIVIADTPLSN